MPGAALSASTNGPEDSAEQERQLLSSFWMYVQPMNLYKLLQQRHAVSATYLRRNLTYHQAKPSAPSSNSSGWIDVSLQAAAQQERPFQPVLVIVGSKIVQAKLSEQAELAFQPQAVFLVEAPSSSRVATVRLPIQHAPLLSGILLLTPGDKIIGNVVSYKHRGNRAGHQGQASLLQLPVHAGCTKKKAFGLLPVGSRVAWSFTPLSDVPEGRSEPFQVRLTKGRLYTTATTAAASGFQLHVTNKHKFLHKGATFQMQLKRMPATRAQQTAEALPASIVTAEAQLARAAMNKHQSRAGRVPSLAMASRAGQLDTNNWPCVSASCSPTRQLEGHATAEASGMSQHRVMAAHGDSESIRHVTSSLNSEGKVYFSHCLHPKRHIKEATTGFTCFACKQRCKGLLGLQQHITACHNLFDYHCIQAEPKSGIPTILSRCPPDLFDSYGNLCCLESQAMAWTDHQLGCGSSYYCPPGLRKLRLQQYHMSDEALQRLPRSLTKNPFSKAEWRKQYAAAKIDLRSAAKQKANSSSLSPKTKHVGPRQNPHAGSQLGVRPLRAASRPPRPFTATSARAVTQPPVRFVDAGTGLLLSPGRNPPTAVLRQSKSPPPNLMQVNFPESAHQFEDTQPVSPQLQLQQQQQGPAHTAQRQQQQHQHGALHKAQEQPVLHFQHPRKRKFAQLQGEGQAMVPGEAIFSAKAAAAIAAARMHQHDAAQPSGQQSAQGHAPDSTPQSPDLHPSGQRPAQVHRSGSRQSMHSHLELTADAPSQQGLRQKDRGEILPQQGVGTEDHLGLPAGTQPVPLAGLPKPGLPVWSMPAVLGPRPNSAPGLSTQSLHSAEPQLQPSAEVSKPHATGEAQHSRAPWSAAGLPRAGCAAAASSSGRGSVGLAASWCAGADAASSSGAHAPAVAAPQRLKLRPSSAPDYRERVSQRGQQASVSQLSLASRKRGRPASASSLHQDESTVYFHARSHVRMTDAEVAQILQDPASLPDSDDEEDQQAWKVRVMQQLDQLPDLNSTEKEFMLQWNVFLHNKPCHSDGHMAQRCLDFAAAEASRISADLELRQCFMMHLMNLWEFNLLEPSVVDKCIIIATASGPG